MNLATDAAALKADFDRDGFVVVPGFFSPGDTTELIAEVDRYLETVVPTLPQDENFYEVKGEPNTLKYAKFMNLHDPYFAALAADERLLNLAEVMLNSPVVLQHLSMFNKPPRIGAATPPHQDGYYFFLDPNEALTLWLAVDAVDAENGCVRYVTGSNRRGMRPHNKTATLGFSQGVSDYGADDEAQEAVIHAQPGDLLVHHCMTIHRADPNSSNRTRRAIGAVYNAAAAREDHERNERYQKQLNEELARSGKI